MKAFVPAGPLQRPANALGWLITIVAVAFVANCFVAIDRHSHSVSDTFYGWFPYLGVSFLLWDWLARRMER